jgi:hypothetical protein
MVSSFRSILRNGRQLDEVTARHHAQLRSETTRRARRRGLLTASLPSRLTVEIDDTY